MFALAIGALCSLFFQVAAMVKCFSLPRNQPSELLLEQSDIQAIALRSSVLA
jgi:hypothetical protein